MGAKRFDPDAVLDRAVDAFWRDGYEATSAQTLVDAMGINRASLYGTFGSKADLYRRALARYRERTFAELERALDHDGDVLEALAAFLRAQCAQIAGDAEQRGCFLVNACTELGARDEAVGADVREAFGETRELLRRVLEAGQRRGEVRREPSPEALADVVLTTMQGLRVVGKAGAGERRLTAVVDVALDALAPR